MASVYPSHDEDDAERKLRMTPFVQLSKKDRQLAEFYTRLRNAWKAKRSASLSKTRQEFHIQKQEQSKAENNCETIGEAAVIETSPEPVSEVNTSFATPSTPAVTDSIMPRKPLNTKIMAMSSKTSAAERQKLVDGSCRVKVDPAPHLVSYIPDGQCQKMVVSDLSMTDRQLGKESQCRAIPKIPDSPSSVGERVCLKGSPDLTAYRDETHSQPLLAKMETESAPKETAVHVDYMSDKPLPDDQIWGFSDSDPEDWLYAEERDILDECVETVRKIKKVNVLKRKATKIERGRARLCVVTEEITEFAKLLRPISCHSVTSSRFIQADAGVAVTEHVQECVSSLLPVKLSSVAAGCYGRDAEPVTETHTEETITNVLATELPPLNSSLVSVDGEISVGSYGPIARALHSVQEVDFRAVVEHQNLAMREFHIPLVDVKHTHPQLMPIYKADRKPGVFGYGPSLSKDGEARGLRRGPKVRSGPKSAVKKKKKKLAQMKETQALRDNLLLSKFESSVDARCVQKEASNAFQCSSLDDLLVQEASSVVVADVKPEDEEKDTLCIDRVWSINKSLKQSSRKCNSSHSSSRLQRRVQQMVRSDRSLRSVNASRNMVQRDRIPAKLSSMLTTEHATSRAKKSTTLGKHQEQLVKRSENYSECDFLTARQLVTAKKAEDLVYLNPLYEYLETIGVGADEWFCNALVRGSVLIETLKRLFLVLFAEKLSLQRDLDSLRVCLSGLKKEIGVISFKEISTEEDGKRFETKDANTEAATKILNEKPANDVLRNERELEVIDDSTTIAEMDKHAGPQLVTCKASGSYEPGWVANECDLSIDKEGKSLAKKMADSFHTVTTGATSTTKHAATLTASSLVNDAAEGALGSVVDAVASSLDQPGKSRGSGAMASKESVASKSSFVGGAVRASLGSVVEVVASSIDKLKQHGGLDHSVGDDSTVQGVFGNIGTVASAMSTRKDSYVTDSRVVSTIQKPKIEFLTLSASDKHQIFAASMEDFTGATGFLEVSGNSKASIVKTLACKNQSESVALSGSQSTQDTSLEFPSSPKVVDSNDQQIVKLDKCGAVNALIDQRSRGHSLASCDANSGCLSRCSSPLITKSVSPMPQADKISGDRVILAPSVISDLSTPDVIDKSGYSDTNLDELNKDWYQQKLVIDNDGITSPCAMSRSGQKLKGEGVYTHLAAPESDTTSGNVSDAGCERLVIGENTVSGALNDVKMADISQALLTGNSSSPLFKSSNPTTNSIISHDYFATKSEIVQNSTVAGPSRIKTSCQMNCGPDGHTREILTEECHPTKIDCGVEKFSEFLESQGGEKALGDLKYHGNGVNKEPCLVARYGKFSASCTNRSGDGGIPDQKPPTANSTNNTSTKTDSASLNKPQSENLFEQNSSVSEIFKLHGKDGSLMQDSWNFDVKVNSPAETDKSDHLELKIQASYSVCSDHPSKLNGEHSQCDSSPSSVGMTEDNVDLVGGFASSVHLMRVKEHIDLPPRCHDNRLHVPVDFDDRSAFEVPQAVREVMSIIVNDVEEKNDLCSVVKSVMNHMLFAVDLCHSCGGQPEKHLADWYQQTNFGVLMSSQQLNPSQPSNNHLASKTASEQEADAEDMSLVRKMTLHSLPGLTEIEPVLRSIVVPSSKARAAKRFAVNLKAVTVISNASAKQFEKLKKNLLSCANYSSEARLYIGKRKERRQYPPSTANTSDKPSFPLAKRTKLISRGSEQAGRITYTTGKNINLLKSSASVDFEKNRSLVANSAATDSVEQKIISPVVPKELKKSLKIFRSPEGFVCLDKVNPRITITSVKMKGFSDAKTNNEGAVSEQQVQSLPTIGKYSSTMKNDDGGVTSIDQEVQVDTRLNQDERSGNVESVLTGQSSTDRKYRKGHSKERVCKGKGSIERLRRCELKNLVKHLWDVIDPKISHKPTTYVVLDLARQCINKLKRETEKSGQLRRSLLVKKRLLRSKVQSLQRSRTAGSDPGKSQLQTAKPDEDRTEADDENKLERDNHENVSASKNDGKPEAGISDSSQECLKDDLFRSLSSSSSDSIRKQFPVTEVNGETEKASFTPLRPQVYKLVVSEKAGVLENTNNLEASAPDPSTAKRFQSPRVLSQNDLGRKHISVTEINKSMHRTQVKRVVLKSNFSSTPQASTSKLTSPVSATHLTSKPNCKTFLNLTSVKTNLEINRASVGTRTVLSIRTSDNGSCSLVNHQNGQIANSAVPARTVPLHHAISTISHRHTLNQFKQYINAKLHSKNTNNAVPAGISKMKTKDTTTPTVRLQKTDNALTVKCSRRGSKGRRFSATYFPKHLDSPRVAEEGTLNETPSTCHMSVAGASSIQMHQPTSANITIGVCYSQSTNSLTSSSECSPSTSSQRDPLFFTGGSTQSCIPSQPVLVNNEGIVTGMPANSSKASSTILTMSNGREVSVLTLNSAQMVHPSLVSSTACSSAAICRVVQSSSQIPSTLPMLFEGLGGRKVPSCVTSADINIPATSNKLGTLHSPGPENIPSTVFKLQTHAKPSAPIIPNPPVSLMEGYFVPVNVLFVPLHEVDKKGKVCKVLSAKLPSIHQLHSFRILNFSKPCSVSLKTVRGNNGDLPLSDASQQSISYCGVSDVSVGKVDRKLTGGRKRSKCHEVTRVSSRSARRTQKEAEETPFKVARLEMVSGGKKSSIKETTTISHGLTRLDSSNESLPLPVTPANCTGVSIDHVPPQKPASPIVAVRGNSLTPSVSMEKYVVPEIQQRPSLKRYVSTSGARITSIRDVTSVNAHGVELVCVSDSESDDDIIIL